jgi:hypothetical protein
MNLSSGLALMLAGQAATACELCAIYSADNALGNSGSGFWFSIAEQYIPYNTSQFNGREVQLANPSYVYSYVTHIVPGYNFSSALGVSLNLPVTYLNFRRTDLLYSRTAPPVLFTETGTEFGLGDLSLIGRLTLFQKHTMRYAVAITALAGVKFPTGDASRLDDEVAQAALFQSFLPPGTPHDPLGHSISSVHENMLALGSGSYDGVFGLNGNGHWRRLYLTAQIQYYLRTQGEAGFRYGDELIVSGGPGAFLLLNDFCTLSLQANAVYDTNARDELLGTPSNSTGVTAWYLGPLLTFTLGERFSVNFELDVPLQIANNGFQSVPSLRIESGISYRF